MKYFFENPEIVNQASEPDEVFYDLPTPFRESIQNPVEELDENEEELDEEVEEEPIDYEEPDNEDFDPDDDSDFYEQLVTGGYKRPVYKAISRTGGKNSISADEAYAYYVQQHGLPEHVAAGIIGNLQVESNLDSKAVGDSGTSFGLAQWHNERWSGLVNSAKKQGKNPHDPYFQLDYILNEPGESKQMLDRVKQTRTPEQAAQTFGRTYERYNRAQANEAGRASNARQVLQTPNAQFGAQIATQIGGQLVNTALESIFNPDAKYQGAAQNFLNLQGQQGQQDDAELALAKQKELEEQTVQYAQQGGSSFNDLRAFKPATSGFGTLTAGTATGYKQNQASKYNFDFQPDSLYRDGISNYMKEQGNNVTSQAYTNNAPFKAAMNPASTTAQTVTPGLQTPKDWMSSLFNPGTIDLATQVMAGLAGQNEARQIRNSEWEKLRNQPYQNLKTAKQITGQGQPAYAKYGFHYLDDLYNEE